MIVQAATGPPFLKNPTFVYSREHFRQGHVIHQLNDSRWWCENNDIRVRNSGIRILFYARTESVVGF